MPLVFLDPDALSEEKVLEKIRGSMHFNNGKFSDEYYYHLNQASAIAQAAKIYILDNYTKVKDWSQLRVSPLHHNKGHVYIRPKDVVKKQKLQKPFKKNGKTYVPARSVSSPIIKKVLDRFDRESVTAETLTDCVYDWTDGDFSLTINGVDYLWLHDQSVIEIANYIEQKLKG